VVVSVRPLGDEDTGWAAAIMTDEWGSVLVARKGELLDASVLPGFVAEVGGSRTGLVVVAARGRDYEVVSLSATSEGLGIGSALLQRCVEDARSRGCRRVWLITTNDNVRAIGFYQRFGMDLVALHRHGVERSRQVKPSIPLVAASGIAIAHELEFELLLGAAGE
jgi:GNAT superfamily N-acetyltransferase